MSQALCRRTRSALISLSALLLCSLSSHSYAEQTPQYQRPKSSILKPCNDFDFFAYSKQLHKNHRAVHGYHPGVDPEKWQTAARAVLRAILAVPETAPSALNAKVGEKVKCSVVIDKKVHQYTRQEVLFYSRPNYPVGGFLLLPISSKERYSAILCIPGHASRVDDIVGLHPDGRTRNTLVADYQHDLAVQCVANGYAALAIESLGIGSRALDSMRKKYPQGSSCKQFEAHLNLFGDSLMGYRVYDAMRAIDFLQSRKDIKKDSIATMGISAGGAVSLLVAAVDPRVKCAIVSCFLNEIGSSLLDHNHCGCNYVPNLGKQFQMSDIAGLVAPRLLLLEATKDDQTFPFSGAKSAFEKTRTIYTALKAPENVTLTKTSGDHQFDGREAFKRLKSEFK